MCEGIDRSRGHTDMNTREGDEMHNKEYVTRRVGVEVLKGTRA